MRVTVDKDGGIVLPVSVRDATGVGPGSVLDVEGRPGEIRLTAAPTASGAGPRLVREGRVLVARTGAPAGALGDPLARDREDRTRDLLNPAGGEGEDPV